LVASLHCTARSVELSGASGAPPATNSQQFFAPAGLEQ
jgi:hypothetical protein